MSKKKEKKPKALRGRPPLPPGERRDKWLSCHLRSCDYDAALAKRDRERPKSTIADWVWECVSRDLPPLPPVD